MATEIKHRHSDTRGIFYLNLDGEKVGELTYSFDNPIMTIDHTGVDVEHEGKGYASQLLDEAVTYARQNELKINPLCPFAEVKFDRNAEYQKVQA